MTTGKLQVIEPLAFTATPAESGSSGLSNLYSPDPKEAYTVPGVATHNLWLDFGSAVSLDTFAVLFTNAASSTVTVYSNTGPSGAGAVSRSPAVALRSADTKTTRANAIVRLAAPVTSRYWTLVFSANSPALTIGAICCGRAFEAEWDREWGSGRRLIDTGKATALWSGGFGAAAGARKGAYSWTFGDLTDAEVETLWGIMIRNGMTSPVVVMERDDATAGRSEQIHYGLMTKLDAFERRGPGETRWSMEIEEWI